MTGFLQDLDNIMQAAEQSPADTEWTILTGLTGGVRMIAGSDWPLESLRCHHGAAAAFRTRRHLGEVVVEGRTARQSFGLQSRPPAEVARLLLR